MFTRRGRLISLLLFALLTALSFVGLSRLTFDFNFEAFLPEDDPDITFFSDFKENFQPGSNTVTIGIQAKGSSFDPEFLSKVHRLTICSRRLPLAEDAYSLLTLKDYLYDPLYPMQIPVLDPKNSEDLGADSLRIMQDPRFPGNLISYDGRMLFVNISTTAERHQSEENGFVEALDDLLLEFGFEDASLVGYPIFHYHLTNYQSSEFGLYTGIGTLIMLICMVILFRRFWGTLVAFLSVFLGMIIFFGMLGWIGRPIDLMGTLFPVLMVIVGTSDVVHIMTKYVDELRSGKSKQESLKITFKEIGIATFLTSLTTAIGFLSLYSSNMPPIRNFGLFAALGVFVAFGTVILLTTALVSWFSADALMKPRKGPKPFSRLLVLIDGLTRRRTRTIAIGALLFAVICSLGASQTNLSLTSNRDLPFGSKILKDFNTIDHKTKGLNPMDIAVEVKDGHSFYEIEVQREMDRIENELRKNPVYGPVTSPLMFFKIANMAWDGPYSENFVLAESQEEFDKQMEVGKKFISNPLGSLLSEDAQKAWLFVKVPDLGSGRLWELKDEFKAITRDNPYFTMTQTGPRHIFDKHQELLVFSLLKSLGLAILMVSIFMALVFRNWRVVIISLVPNVVPLMATAGAIGFLGFQLDPKVAIVFTVAFGIAVDDSIHFLSRYKLERDKGFDVNTAIHNTFAETGRAIIITTLILFFGFGALVLSSFPPTFTIGFLLALTLAVALAGDFFLLPVFIRWFAPREQ